MKFRWKDICIASLLLAGSSALAAEAVRQPAQNPPVPPSPVEQFRQWLRMTPEALEVAIGGWPEAKREILRRKVLHYKDLGAFERERRLFMVELTWYIQPLLNAPAASREQALKVIPAPLQPVVRERLAEWDRLPAAVQQQALDTELGIRYMARFKQAAARSQVDPQTSSEIERKLRDWSHMSPPERASVAAQLQQLFNLPPEQREKVVNVLPESERKEIQRTLENFARMSPEKRRACIQSFRRFASMTPAERSEFLRNASRWQAMDEKERKAWRELVDTMPPMPEIAANAPLPRITSPLNAESPRSTN